MKIIYGPAKSGKTTKLFEEVKKSIAKHKIIIVPEQFVLETEKSIMNFLGVKGLMDIEVLSFSRLSHRIFEEIGYPSSQVIDDLGTYLIVEDIINANISKLKVLGGKSSDGLIEEILSCIYLFKDECLSPEDIKVRLLNIDSGLASKELLEIKNLLEEKLHDIAIIYEEYNERTSSKYLDNKGMFSLLSQRINESQFIKDSDIFVDSFSGLSELEKNIMLALNEYCKNMYVTVCTPKARHITLTDNYKFFLEKILSQKSGYTTERLSESYISKDIIEFAEISLSPINEIEKRQENDKAEISKDENNITCIEIYESVDAEEESMFVANKIVELIRDKGYTYSDIAVISPATESHKPFLKKHFKIQNIPSFIDERTDLDHNPITNYIKGLLKIVKFPNFAGGYIELLSSGVTKFPARTVGEFINYAQKYDNKMYRIEAALRKDIEKGREKNGNNSEKQDKRELLLEEFDSIRKLFRKKDMTYTEFVEKLMNSLSLHKYSHKFSTHEEREYIVKLWREMVDIFDQIIEVMGDRLVSFNQIYKTIQSAIKKSTSGNLPQFENYVLIGNLKRTKLNSVKALFLMGVNDGIIPEEIPEGFLSDIDLALLNLESTKKNDDKQIYDLYETITRASEKLILTYGIQNGLKPSAVIDKAKEYFKAKVKKVSEEPLLAIQSRDGISLFLTESIRKKKEEKAILPEYDYIIEKLKDSLETKEYLDYSPDESDVDIEFLPKVVSVSLLENYHGCQYKNFIEKVVKTKQINPEIPNSLNIGNIIHKLLEMFAKNMLITLKENDITPETLDRIETRKKINEIVEGLIAMLDPDVVEIYNSSKQDQYMLEKIKRISAYSINKIIRQYFEDGFVPVEFEKEFIQKVRDHLYLKGIIDRIDVMHAGSNEVLAKRYDDYLDADKVSKEMRRNGNEVWKTEYFNTPKTYESIDTYFRIVDYKSGNKKFEDKKIRDGKDLQLMTYLNVLDDISMNIQPFGSYYFKTKRNVYSVNMKNEIRKREELEGIGISGDMYSSADEKSKQKLQEMLELTRNNIVDYSEEFCSGSTKVNPDKGKCSNCDYKSICQYDYRFRKLSVFKGDYGKNRKN